MLDLIALVNFAALSAGTWCVSVACFQATGSDDPSTAAVSVRSPVAICAIGAVTLTGFIPFPAGYIACQGVNVSGFFDLTIGRASVLMDYLAVASILSRLGVLSAV